MLKMIGFIYNVMLHNPQVIGIETHFYCSCIHKSRLHALIIITPITPPLGNECKCYSCVLSGVFWDHV